MGLFLQCVAAMTKQTAFRGTFIAITLCVSSNFDILTLFRLTLLGLKNQVLQPCHPLSAKRGAFMISTIIPQLWSKTFGMLVIRITMLWMYTNLTARSQSCSIIMITVQFSPLLLLRYSLINQELYP